MAITPRQLDSIRAHVETGTIKAAAARLGVSSNTLRGHLAGAHAPCPDLDEEQDVEGLEKRRLDREEIARQDARCTTG